METWKHITNNGIEEAQDFLESKKIISFQAVKEFFKNIFLDFIDKVESGRAGFTEKKHEIYFYIGDLSMSLIDQDNNITIWRLDSKACRVIAILDFESGHAFVKYVNPVRIAYLCEDEIEEIFEQTFQPSPILH